MEFHTGSIERNGYFVQAMYMTEWDLQPIIKYEAFDPNIDGDDDAQSIITWGLNYFFNDWTRLQINYMYKVEEIEVKNDELALQLQVKF